MPERRTRLKGLGINRVAFVPAGDNPEAHVLLWKSATVEDHGAASNEEETVAEEITKAPKHLTTSRWKRILGIRDELDALLTETDPKEGNVSDEAKALIEELPEDKRDDVAKYIADLEEKLEKASTTVDEPVADPEPEPAPETALDKALADQPEVAKAFEDMRKDLDEARKTVDEMRDAEDLRQATADAEGLGIDGETLKALRKSAPKEIADEVERQMRSVQAANDHLTRTIGKADVDNAGEERFESLAKEFQKTHPELSLQQAMVEVAKTPAGREARNDARQEV